MRPLSAAELLAVWERGLGAPPCERALAIVAAASPDSSAAMLARVSIGRRDAQLLQLREWAFGPELVAFAECPRCHAPLETTLCVRDLKTGGDEPIESVRSIVVGEYDIRCRPPNSEDLLSCAGLDIAAGRRRLFARCVIEARHDATPVSIDELPGEIVSQVIADLAASDPQADTRINLICPDCQHAWIDVFDIASFFWTEIDVWARRLIRDISMIARAYGWRERDILALSPLRRQMYLAMAQA
jgi:hypothetical protein